MKKVLSILLCITLLMVMTACGSDKAKDKKDVAKSKTTENKIGRA